jgi:dephospho-CoA kinase
MNPRIGKPIIGLTGGIGSGKTFVAGLFGELGCMVINSDELVREAYESPKVKEALRRLWGAEVFAADGSVDRPAVARRIFSSPADRAALEAILHPIVAEQRDGRMRAAANDPAVLAFVWDTPLLLETGLHEQCDAVVFIEAPAEVREDRVRSRRGWEPSERTRREKLQLPLDKKQEMSDYLICNDTDARGVRDQTRKVLGKILAGFELLTQPSIE